MAGPARCASFLAVCCCALVAFHAPQRSDGAYDGKCVSKHFALEGDFDECKHVNGSSAAPGGEKNATSFLVHSRHPYEDISGYKTRDTSPSKTVRRLFNVNSSMVLLNSPTEMCRKHSQIYLRELEKLTMWALNMYDASAKIPSGILSGNINQFGDFDQCLGVNDPTLGIKGQYCLTYVEFTLPPNADEKLIKILNLIQSHFAFRSRLEDLEYNYSLEEQLIDPNELSNDTTNEPGHRVPRYSTINWAVCTPASCPPADIESELHALLSRYVDATEVNFRLKVDPLMCQTSGTSYVPTAGSLCAIFSFGVLFTTIIISTIMDFHNMFLDPQYCNMTRVLYSFSLKRNVRQLLSVTDSPEDIKSLHGIRTLNAIMLLISHKSMVVFFNPYINRTAMSEQISQPWSVVARAASLYTDPFILISGLLTSISFLKHLDRSGTINLSREYISRYIRLIPSVSAVMMFCMVILPYLGSGPQWNLVIKQHADICQKSWWRNLLLIQNYSGFKNVCLSHTHHIGIDSQLYFVSPLLIWTLWKWPKKGIVALLGLAVISTGLRYYVALTRQLNLFIHFGTLVSQMYDTADYSYILPTHRLTVYIMGIFLGYCLRYVGRNYQIKNSHLKLGWLIAVVCFYEAYIQPSKMGKRDYVYNPTDAANYSAFAPIYWCIFFSWIIFVSYTGNDGLISKFFSWKGFRVFTRLSYTFYLTQFPVLFYNVGSNRAPLEYSFGIFLNAKEYIIIVLTSAVLTLAVEMPFNNIRTSFLKKTPRPSEESTAAHGQALKRSD